MILRLQTKFFGLIFLRFRIYYREKILRMKQESIISESLIQSTFLI